LSKKKKKRGPRRNKGILLRDRKRKKRGEVRQNPLMPWGWNPQSGENRKKRGESKKEGKTPQEKKKGRRRIKKKGVGEKVQVGVEDERIYK